MKNPIKASIEAAVLVSGLGFIVGGVWMWSTAAGMIALGVALLLAFAAMQKG